MTRWNRLRRLAGRLLADQNEQGQAGDAIYLTETAYRNHQPGPTKAPLIRERHFGADLRRSRRGEAEPARAKTRHGLLARLGIGRPAAAPGDEPGYFGTKVLGTPHPPRKDEPAPIPEPLPEPVRERVPEPVRPPVAVEAPVPAVEPPAVELPAAPKAAKPKAARPRIAKVKAGGDKARKPAPAPARAAAPVPDPSQALDSLFGDETGPARAAAARPAPAAPKPKPVATAKKKKKMDRGDVTVAVLGTALAVTCALFPWYIFFNQEKFGVREFVFSGGGGATRSTPGIAYQPRYVGKPFATAEVPKMELDFFPTATLPTDHESVRAVPVSEQPFPADRAAFRLVHVANGRAMIEDSDGLWVVQRGSQLPDASRVVAIEQRQGRWVLVTSNDTVVELDG